MIDFTGTTFYLGGNTPNGFFSFFSEIYNPNDNWRLYIIKGGPGTGKSSFIKNVATEVEKEGYAVERIPCASDPTSLDGVIFHELKTAIADGTAPHVIEPKFPGAIEQILNLGDYWDSNMLRENAFEIRRLTLLNSEEHKRCNRFISVAASIDQDTKKLVSPFLMQDKIKRFAKRFAAREFNIKKGVPSKEYHRFLSAITPFGFDVKTQTATALCGKIISIDDPFGLSSSMLLEELRKVALLQGLDIIICPCPLRPETDIEHLFLPELGLGLMTQNLYHKAPLSTSRTIHYERFCDKEKVKAIKNRITFNGKVKLELLDEAVIHLQKAKALHDILESYYIKAMDFDKVNNLAKKVILDILNTK